MTAAGQEGVRLLVSLLHPGDLAAADWLLILAWVALPIIIYAAASHVARRPEVEKLFDDDDRHK
jgi:hypothetical protein